MVRVLASGRPISAAIDGARAASAIWGGFDAPRPLPARCTRTGSVLRRLALALLVTAVACGSNGGSKSASTTTAVSTSQTAPAGVMQVTSPAFADAGEIPKEFTCDG